MRVVERIKYLLGVGLGQPASTPLAPSGFESFSQSGEDAILRFLFSAIGVSTPSYLDIGANHPTYLSNTYAFYKTGSRGVCVEPNPVHADAFRCTRPEDTLREVGVMPEPGSATLYLMDPDTMSTFSQAEADRLNTEFGYKLVARRTVEVVTINDLISTHFPAGPDLVSLDVEGLDDAIIRSCRLAPRPRVFCVEAVEHGISGLANRRIELGTWLEEHGYIQFASTYINAIYVDREVWVTRGASGHGRLSIDSAS